MFQNTLLYGPVKTLGLKPNINPFENQSKHDFMDRKNMRDIISDIFSESIESI